MSMYPIATQTLTDSTTVAFNFLSIPQNFSHLQLRGYVRTTNVSVSAFAYCYLNADFGSYTFEHWMQGNGSSIASNGVTGGIGFGQTIPPGANATAGMYGSFIMDIFDYTSTVKQKTIRTFGGFDNNGTGGYVQLKSGVYAPPSIATISSMQISTGNAAVYFTAGSRFDLYGFSTSTLGSN